MDHPKVTVVIPTYNREGFIGAAIGSVLAQTFADFELIVVDDGSTDGTAAVVAAIRDPRIRYTRQEHRGISAAMNHGLRAARGAYIARLDSDDVWLPELLETEVAVLDARPEVGAAYARGRGVDEGGRPTLDVWGMAERFPGDSFRSMLYGDFTCNITVVARRECFERAGWFDETMVTNEDWDLWLRVARHYRFAYTDRVLAHFRRHQGNITGLASPFLRATLEQRVRVLDKAFAAPDLPAPIQAMKAVAYRNVYSSAALGWLSAGEYREAGRSCARAVRVAPNPAFAAARLAVLLINWRVLHRHSWGRRLIEWQGRARRWLWR